MMNKTITKRAVALLAAIVMGGGMALKHGDATPVELGELWADPEIFAPEFFPESESVSPEDIFISGLEQRFPHRVSREEPELDPGPSRDPHVVELFEGVSYVRVYTLPQALPVLEQLVAERTLVIDLRNVRAGRDDALALGGLLALNDTVSLALSERTPANGAEIRDTVLPIEPAGLRRPLQPVFVLTNNETAGPLEVLLAELKDKGQIITVGTPTAGKTGSFRRVWETPSLYVLSGELRPASGESLLEDGFIPAVRLDVPAGKDREAYLAMEEGESLKALIQAENDTGDPPPHAGSLDSLIARDEERRADDEDGTVDTILQRAYFIAVALRSMGKIASP